MTKLTVERTSATPGGVSVVPDRPVIYRRALRVRVPNFMLEDVVDAALAKAALAHPNNKPTIPWEVVKEQLGL